MTLPWTTRNSGATTDGSNSSYIIYQLVYGNSGLLATTICMDAMKTKGTQMPRKATTMNPCITLQTGSATNLQQANLPTRPHPARADETLVVHTRQLLETWMRLVTPTVLSNKHSLMMSSTYCMTPTIPSPPSLPLPDMTY